MKFLIILAVISLSTTQAFARTRVLRAADHEGLPHDEVAAAIPVPVQSDPVEHKAQKPGGEVLLEKSLGLLAVHGDEQTKKDVEEFRTHFKNGDFQSIVDAVNMELDGKEVTPENLLQSVAKNSADSKYKELILRVGKAGKELGERLEKLQGTHDATGSVVQEGAPSVAHPIHIHHAN